MEADYGFINVYSTYYYTDVLEAFVALSAGIIGFIRRKKFKELTFFYIYPLASSFQSIYFYVFDQTSDYRMEETILSNNISIALFLITELTIIYLFLKQILFSRAIKAMLGFVLILYYVLILYFSIFLKIPKLPIPELFIAQAVLIVPPTTFYFYELFKIVPKLDLLREPAFWICTGVLIYFLCTLPLFLSKNSIFDLIGNINYDTTVYCINYIFYSILFLFIIKAYLCDPEKKR